MKSKAVQRLLRALITLLGAGIGAGLVALVLQAVTLANPGMAFSVKALAITYTSACVAFALLFFLLSNRIISGWVAWSNTLEQHLDKMPFNQVMASITGLICGLIIAALISQILNFVGTSIFTTAVSAILYVAFGATGLTLGRKRSRDFAEYVMGFRERRALKKSERRALSDAEESAGDAEDEPTEQTSALTVQPKILDTSVIIDGRIFDVAKTGFLEGEIVVPQFVLGELQHIADSADPLRRARGRRGLDVLQKLQTELKLPVRIDETDYENIAEVDVKLLRMAKEGRGQIVTGDFNLNKVAAVSGIRVLNLNDLAGALRPAVIAGEEMTVLVSKEGKEPGQGVGYLEDGTMIVVEGGRKHVGETVEVVVSTVLQTSAGRMIFTKIKDAGDA